MSLKEIIPSFAMKKTPGTDDFTGERRGHSKQPTLLCYLWKQTLQEKHKTALLTKTQNLPENAIKWKATNTRCSLFQRHRPFQHWKNQCKPLKEKAFKKQTLTIVAVALEEAWGIQSTFPNVFSRHQSQKRSLCNPTAVFTEELWVVPWQMLFYWLGHPISPLTQYL